MDKVHLEWQGGMKINGYDEQGHKTVYDSGAEGVVTAGPTPMQVFLQVVAACGAMDIVSILEKRRKKIDSFKVEVEGERVDTYPKIYRTIKIKYIVSGLGITDKEMKMAVELSVEKFCSAMAMIDKTKTEIEVAYKII